MDPVEPGVTGQGSSHGSNACLACRRVKMKCLLQVDANRCERCTRKNFDCVFQQHRRGRKHGMRLSAYRSNNSHIRQERPLSAQPGSSTGHDTLRTIGNPLAATNSSGFSHPDLASASNVKGKFSLRNVFSTITEPPSSSSSSSPSKNSNCPITKALINQVVAEQLFQGFMKTMNPLISQFDPTLHTFAYVRERSSFLLTAILAAAAKAYNSSIHAQLREHAETLFVEAIRNGTKSVEVVQAILLLTYWKDPEDTRVFVNLGIAIRICIDLGFNTLEHDPAAEGQMTEAATRKLRDVQRTWLVLFVYDRSISIQTGKPWMIERSDFIDVINDWHNSSFAIANDHLLRAFVKLRLLTSDVVQILVARNRNSLPLQDTLRPLLRVIRNQINDWERSCSTTEPCHSFLVEFYGQHVLFFVFSIPLQHSLASQTSSLDLDAFWTSYNAAIRMLRLATLQPATSALYFAQDSIHIMLAHSAAFLVKLLLSIPRSFRAEVETDVRRTLHEAAHCFASQSAPPNSACALQAAFLGNAVSLLKEVPSQHARRQDQSFSASQDTGHTGPLDGSVMTLAGNASNSNVHESSQSTHTYGSQADPNMAVSQDYNSFDEEFWASMFASAGFDINDGMFLPDMIS